MFAKTRPEGIMNARTPLRGEYVVPIEIRDVLQSSALVRSAVSHTDLRYYVFVSLGSRVTNIALIRSIWTFVSRARS